MRGHRFPPEVRVFIREHVQGRTCRELTALVNEHFGEQLFTESAMQSYKKDHNLRSGTPRHRKVGYSPKWPNEVLDYLVEVAKGRSREEIARLINERFGAGTMTTAQVHHYMCNHGICSGLDTRIKPGHVPFNKGRKGYCAPGCERTWFRNGNRPADAVPIGTEKEREDGYVYVKVRDGHKNRNWVQKHRLIWEKAHGPVLPDHVVIFLNGDRRDFRLENLKMISRAENAVMNKRGLHFSDSALTESGTLIAKVVLEVNRRKSRGKAKEEVMDRNGSDLKKLVQLALEKAGGPIVLELMDGGKVRRVRINPDGRVEKLWKEKQK